MPVHPQLGGLRKGTGLRGTRRHRDLRRINTNAGKHRLGDPEHEGHGHLRPAVLTPVPLTQRPTRHELVEPPVQAVIPELAFLNVATTLHGRHEVLPCHLQDAVVVQAIEVAHSGYRYSVAISSWGSTGSSAPMSSSIPGIGSGPIIPSAVTIPGSMNS